MEINGASGPWAWVVRSDLENSKQEKSASESPNTVLNPRTISPHWVTSGWAMGAFSMTKAERALNHNPQIILRLLKRALLLKLTTSKQNGMADNKVHSCQNFKAPWAFSPYKPKGLGTQAWAPTNRVIWSKSKSAVFTSFMMPLVKVESTVSLYIGVFESDIYSGSGQW